ncbi:hypothetical protein THF1C08_320105 [Vibrio jasicida]|uniref:Uncharacterized protein n=1 Tax=Vibrio jasicida TaxID=766224 RepID=A0AAU9QSR5_9VIBR|nr:hypothetical protein THF1C08_320105 [Vibrio jasicida]CAH1597576.1 hypothetical protein THF1A12_320105 [Vibrio jasicida]
MIFKVYFQCEIVVFFCYKQGYETSKFAKKCGIILTERKSNLHDLSKLNDSDIALWVRGNVDTFVLITSGESHQLVDSRHKWEEKRNC